MKRNLFVAAVFLLSVFTLSSFSIRENPQDTPREGKVKKHIKLETVDDQGKKTSLDTVIENGDFFVWHGDTIGGKTDFKWSSKDGLKLDSLLKDIHVNIDYDIEDNGNGKVIVMKSGNGGKQIVREFITDGDSSQTFTFHVNSNNLMGDKDVMFWNDKDGNKTFFAPDFPNLPNVPDAPRVIFSGKTHRDNVIDLSDPGIISYKKKKNKDGTEKITVVRKQVDENDVENIEEIITTPKNVIFNGSPQHIKRIKIIKDDGKDKKIEIEENSENN